MKFLLESSRPRVIENMSMFGQKDYGYNCFLWKRWLSFFNFIPGQRIVSTWQKDDGPCDQTYGICQVETNPCDGVYNESLCGGPSQRKCCSPSECSLFKKIMFLQFNNFLTSKTSVFCLIFKIVIFIYRSNIST